jgi:hypothetical protein
VPNLALEPVRFHQGLVGYDADKIEISTATAQITKMYAAFSSTHATPEIWQDCCIPLPFPVQESFIRKKNAIAMSTLLDKSHREFLFLRSR